MFEYKFIVGNMREDLITRANDLMKLVLQESYDTLLFVDRSARPVSWIFKSFWKVKYPNRKIPKFVYICTGKKKNLLLDDSSISQIQKDLGPDARRKLSGKVLIVDDIEHDGIQRKFLEQVLEEIYKPEAVGYFEWNKLGGIRLPHGLSYEDDGSFMAKVDESKKYVVEEINKEIQHLADYSK